MPLLSTDALVLHVMPYSETSRIFRLATRDAGVQSVLAKGARKAQRRYGSALDLFASGVAQVYTKEGRDLNTLAQFDVVRARPELAEVGRFTAASAIAELVMRVGARDDAHPALYDVVVASLEALGRAAEAHTRAAALAGAWRIVGEMGVAPALDVCASCHAPIDPDADVGFSHAAGGALCPACARGVAQRRTLPAAARATVRGWLAGRDVMLDDEASGRAHQRLLREFLTEHVSDGRPMRAFDVWERARWDAA